MKPPRHNHENYETHLYGNWEIHKKPDFFNSYNWHYSRSGSGSIAKLANNNNSGRDLADEMHMERSKMKRKSLRQMDERMKGRMSITCMRASVTQNPSKTMMK